MQMCKFRNLGKNITDEVTGIVVVYIMLIYIIDVDCCITANII